MASRKTYIPNSQSGFTLMELLIVLAIMATLAALGLFVSMDFYRSYAFQSEEHMLVSLLEKARGASLNNADQSAHGVHVEAGKYVYFVGSTYDPVSSQNQIVGGSSAVSNNGPVDVVFAQATGETTPTTVTITDKNSPKTANITINSEGGINW